MDTHIHTHTTYTHATPHKHTHTLTHTMALIGAWAFCHCSSHILLSPAPSWLRFAPSSLETVKLKSSHRDLSCQHCFLGQELRPSSRTDYRALSKEYVSTMPGWLKCRKGITHSLMCIALYCIWWHIYAYIFRNNILVSLVSTPWGDIGSEQEISKHIDPTCSAMLVVVMKLNFILTY